MDQQIINVLGYYSADVDAFLSMYSIDFIIASVKKGKVVINDECTRELNELI